MDYKFKTVNTPYSILLLFFVKIYIFVYRGIINCKMLKYIEIVYFLNIELVVLSC